MEVTPINTVWFKTVQLGIKTFYRPKKCRLKLWPIPQTWSDHILPVVWWFGLIWKLLILQNMARRCAVLTEQMKLTCIKVYLGSWLSFPKTPSPGSTYLLVFKFCMDIMQGCNIQWGPMLNCCSNCYVGLFIFRKWHIRYLAMLLTC